MTDWFGDVGGRRPWGRAAVWVLAVAVSAAVNWSGARQLDSAFDGLSGRESSEPSRNREIEVWVQPLKERFVEASPQVPSNPPDETLNFGARDQQAAQPEPDPSEDSAFPLRESEDESQTFLERGDARERLSPGVYSEAASAQPPPEAGGGSVGELAPRVERQTPEWIDETERGPGSEIPRAESGVRQDPGERERRPGTIALDDGPVESTSERPSPSVNNPAARPLPRKRVGAEVLLAPLNRSESRAARRGELAVDSRLTDFGDYTQRTLEAIQAEWHRLIREVSVGGSETFSSVTVVFYIDRRGSIAEVKVEESTAGELGTMICLDAVHARAPFGAWTREMVRALGDRTRMEITFHYR